MPQIFSRYRLLVVTQDMTDALKHHHPDVPFTITGDDTITGIATLVKIFKKKFQKPLVPQLAQQSPINASIFLILWSPCHPIVG
jgi:hypothetical protein